MRKCVDMKDTQDFDEDRRAWMGLMARAPEGRVAALLDAATARPDFEWLRAPEYGTVMVRGRTGASGAPFNLGEMTVTRCALTLATGEVGHAYLQGRRRTDAEAAALVDAMMQTYAAEDLHAGVLAVLSTEAETRRASRAAKAAATKVDFFTMMRGEA
jgi:alpha-D-ribose 1-methylphosphonate 5-triphosphate synthase subunit PhnG